MKMILQKHTSKFVAGLFNSLGITACVSLTSCGGENKVKQTENQVENLKNGLMSKGLDDKDAQVIVDWLNSNGKDSNYELTAKDLQEIFKNNPNKLNEVAGKLEVILTESDLKPEDEKQKKINEWLNKLKSLKDDEFNKLDDSLTEKVAQKFIANEVDINEVTVIKTKLAGFIKEVKDEKKQNEISIKVGGDGKVTITNVFDKKTTFDFGAIKDLQGFVNALDGKYITSEKVDLSFAFNEKNVKICGHETGFKVTDCFGDFLNCFNTLVGFEKLNVPKLSLKVTGDGVSLIDFACNDDYYKGSDFWSLVKDHADLFGIIKESEFTIEKNGNDGNATVKINDFESSLKWSAVVGEGDKDFVAGSGWGNIFKIKNEEPKPAATSKTEVKIEWDAKKGYKLGDAANFTQINSLDDFGKLVGDLKDKTVTEFKGDFTLKFNGTNVNICGGGNIDITSGKNFEQLLGYVENLRGTHKVINSKFKITIQTSTNTIVLNKGSVAASIIKNATFWEVVNTYQDLFDGLAIEVVRDSTKNSKKGKIGKTVIEVEMFSGEDIAEGWRKVFKKK